MSSGMELIPTIAKTITSVATNKLVDYLRSLNLPNVSNLDPIETNLAQHLTEIVNWSERFQFFGMSSARDTDETTIELNYSSLERRFSISTDSTTEMSEKDILNLGSNVVILGAPGSGKTTTLKRLARTILTSGPVGVNDNTQCPISIRLRDHNFDNITIFEAICDELAIPYARKREKQLNVSLFEKLKKEKYELIDHLKRQLKDLENKLDNSIIPGQRNSSSRSGRLKIDIANKRKEINSAYQKTDEMLEAEAIDIVYKSYLGDKPLEIIVPEILDNLECLLFLDGIDEVAPAARHRLNYSIEKLVRRLSCSRVISSCRTGDFTKMDGFNSVSILSLDNDRIEQIVDLWLKTHEPFMESLENVPYRDLSNRPLFLTYLLAIYNNVGELPPKSSDVYIMIIWLIIKEWDEQRDVKRISKYASFYEEKKLEFLSSITYELTYNQKKKTFSTADLQEAFIQIKDSFGFGEATPKMVVSEIEEHTGLILQAGYDKYEFSHASLQEYLAARYIGRVPFSFSNKDLLNIYPAPLAVAAAISPEPANWLASILFSESGKHAPSPAIKSLLSRFYQEGPLFAGKSIILGYALLNALVVHTTNVKNEVFDILNLNYVKESLIDILTKYVATFWEDSINLAAESSQSLSDKLQLGWMNPTDFRPPTGMSFPILLLRELLEALNLTFKEIKYSRTREIVKM